MWVLNPPYLLFYPDRNNDDVPDGDPEVHLEGFGLEDTHSVANSLRWGPDGWLYGAQGSTVSGNVKRPGDEEKDTVHSMGQLIWRYHPETQAVRDLRRRGRQRLRRRDRQQGPRLSPATTAATRAASTTCRAATTRRASASTAPLSNPYAFGYFPAMKHHAVPRFTHTFVIYEGTALPPKYRGKLFGVGPLQGHVVLSDMQPAGSTFKTKDIGHPITTTDTWFRPVDIAVGPDGGIYVADFYEQRIDHASHYEGACTRRAGASIGCGRRTPSPTRKRRRGSTTAVSRRAS